MDVQALQLGLSGWMDDMAKDLELGRFRFCGKKYLVPVVGMAGQVSTCFAMKAAWQSGLWDKWSTEKQNACIDFIRSFQKEDGTFFDPWLSKKAKTGWRDLANLFLGHIDFKAIQEKKQRNLRAETRQSASALVMVNAKIKYPLPVEINSPDQVIPYFESFNWELPWSAGSHISHQIMFLTVNKVCFNFSEQYNDIIDQILSCLDSIRDPKTGTWFRGDPPDNIKINGAMKIFSGLQWLDRPYPDCSNLLDFALEQPFITDGCGFLNRLFVVQQALKGSPAGYRRDKIHQLGLSALEEIQKFQKPDGGFSFYQNAAQSNYYSAKVSTGNKISDLHGAAMMCWATALTMKLLGGNAPIGGEMWRPHKA